MSKRRDRALIGHLVKKEVESRMSWQRFAEISGVSRATLYRVQNADPRVTEQTLRKIERGLDLPYESLSSVGAHDFDVLIGQGMERGLVQWLQSRSEILEGS